jgi:predicted nucleic acid-binding protein
MPYLANGLYRIWQTVADLAWAMDRSGAGGKPLMDIIIARCAMHVGAVLVSPDKHFRDIPGLKLRKSLQNDYSTAKGGGARLSPSQS